VKLGAQRGQYCELWVVADDQPGLLSLIAASFLRARLIVHSAQVYTWSDDYTRKRSLDTFWVRHRSGREVTSEDVDAIGVMLAEVLDNGVDDEAVSVPPPSGRMGGAPLVQTEVNIDNRTATNHSVIEVITQDRPNLLFWLSVRLAELGLSIWFAKINTEGDRVADVFYVSDGPGGKIADPLRIQHIKSELLAVVERAGNALAA
jgi:[protein-PII] uridylyltransferase